VTPRAATTNVAARANLHGAAARRALLTSLGARPTTGGKLPPLALVLEACTDSAGPMRSLRRGKQAKHCLGHRPSTQGLV
jgi:hypothetical protein